MLLGHQEGQPGHTGDQLRRDLHFLRVVLHLRLREQARPDLEQHTLVLFKGPNSALDDGAPRPTAGELRLKLGNGTTAPGSGLPLLLITRLDIARQMVANPLLQSPLHVFESRVAQAVV